MKQKFRIGLMLLMLLALGIPARAAVVDESLKRDFKAVDGYVVSLMGGEYLIDLDATSRLAVGDIFAVIQPGEKIMHPVTKKVVGTVEQPKAYIQVTKIQSGYSYTRLIGQISGASIQAGDQVRRYQGLPARFWDYSGNGEAVFNSLKAAIPQLEWSSYAASQASRPAAPSAPTDQQVGMVFVYDGGRLEARDPYFHVIHSYGKAKAAGRSIAAAPAGSSASGMRLLPLGTAATAGGGMTMVPAGQAGTAAGSVPYQLEQQATPAGAYAGNSVVRYSTQFPGFQQRGELPMGVTYTDFIVVDGRRLMAAVNGNNVFVYDVSGGGMTRIAQASLPGTAEMLAVNWWRPAPGEALHLAVTGWISRVNDNSQDSQRVSSAILVLNGNSLTVKKNNMGRILGAIDRDGDGVPEVLLGQSFERLTFFGRKMEQYVLNGGKISTVKPGFDMPLDFVAVSGNCMDVTGNGRREFVYVRNNKLYIYSPDGQEQIYESPKGMGGSLATAMHNIHGGLPKAGEVDDVTAMEIKPIAVDLDGDRLQEVVLPGVEKMAMGIVEGLTPGVKNSWISVVKFRSGMFVKGTIGEKMETPLAGVTVTEDEVLFVATDAPKLTGKKGRSYLLSFPLRQ